MPSWAASRPLLVHTPAQQVRQFEIETREHSVTEFVLGRLALCDGIVHEPLPNRELHEAGAPSVGGRNRLDQIHGLLQECLEQPGVRSEFGGTDSELSQFHEHLCQLNRHSAGEVTNLVSLQGGEKTE